MKRLVLAALVVCLMMGSNALAAPVLVDRISNPAAVPSFAFAEDAELCEIALAQLSNADASLICAGGTAVMIDCARSTENAYVMHMLDALGVTHLDMLILTHPHPDHVGGLKALLEAGVTVDLILVNFPSSENDYMYAVYRNANQYGVPIRRITDGEIFEIGGVQYEMFCLIPTGYSVNNRSMVLRTTYGSRTMLWAGDLENSGMTGNLKTHDASCFRADILKYPHHGKSAVREDFLTAVSPRYTILTCSSSYTAGTAVCLQFDLPYTLAEYGMVRLTTDGQTWVLTQEEPID